MKKNTILILVIYTAFLFLQGCMTVNLTTVGYDKPVSMTNNVNKKFSIVKHFNQELKGWFTIFNLVTISEPNVEEAIRREISSVQGDGAINVKIKGQITFIDGIIPFALGLIGSVALPPAGSVLGYLVGARTYTIEGDIIKYTDWIIFWKILLLKVNSKNCKI